MRDIVDHLILGPEELLIIKRHYPSCRMTQTNSLNLNHIIHHYSVIIEDESEDDYYQFLVDNRIAMSSNNFYSRIRSDEEFAKKMQPRLHSPSEHKGK